MRLIILTLAVITLISPIQALGEKTERRYNTQLRQERNAMVANLPSREAFIAYQLSASTIFTAYSLSVQETDSSPCIGAGNNNLCELKKTMQICASRDLPLNTEIYIDGIGLCIIKDRLNKRYLGTNRVDILMNSRKEALQFGKRELKYVVIK